MPAVDKPAAPGLENQLELFSPNRLRYEHTDTIRNDGRETLARTPPQNGARTGGQRAVAGNAAGGGTENEGRNGRVADQVHPAGIDAATGTRPRLGNGAGGIHPASGGRNLAIGHQDDSPKNLNNYRITDDDRLGAGGPKQKFLQNVRAIQLLRKLEAEARPATPDEKAVLVKYVGWGAMPQVFDDRNREWANERKALREELTDGKYEQVRSTTLNAHYTSPAIIRAMYQAAQRFGFQDGQVLEPACGIGHFIGLMPDDMLRRSSITGIEIEPLTARPAAVVLVLLHHRGVAAPGDGPLPHRLTVQTARARRHH